MTVGPMPAMESGDIPGHETMGEVVEMYSIFRDKEAGCIKVIMTP